MHVLISYAVLAYVIRRTVDPMHDDAFKLPATCNRMQLHATRITLNKHKHRTHPSSISPPQGAMPQTATTGTQGCVGGVVKTLQDSDAQ